MIYSDLYFILWLFTKYSIVISLSLTPSLFKPSHSIGYKCMP